MAFSTGTKFGIGIGACFAAALTGSLIGITQTATGEIQAYSTFTYGNSKCNVRDIRMDFKKTSGEVVRLDATEWARKTCKDNDVPELRAGTQFEVKYKTGLVNYLYPEVKPSVLSIAVAKPAA